MIVEKASVWYGLLMKGYTIGYDVKTGKVLEWTMREMSADDDFRKEELCKRDQRKYIRLDIDR
jgi:hypothetical protein